LILEYEFDFLKRIFDVPRSCLFVPGVARHPLCLPDETSRCRLRHVGFLLP
jgi:hypothetical protein